MITISYETPDILEDSNKPVVFSNQSYPYNGLPSPRRFEELLYTVVNEQLGKGIFKNFDAVRLMSGVGEQGRDCALFQKGNSTGVIQCKKHQSNLSKEEFGIEITKFVLYSLLEKKLIFDPSSFNYYIAVSKGLVKECSDFITAFNAEIQTEPLLNSWISYNLKKYISLAPLNLDTYTTTSQALEILTKIQVLPIVPQDLDPLVNSSEDNRISQLFFEVRAVTDNSEIKALREDIKAMTGGIHLDLERINKELSWGSISLKSENNEFSEIPDSHIERTETVQLFDWITQAPKTDKERRPLNMCLLAGNAGIGKTVILKDLYDQLTSVGVAVLGLKADKLASSNIKQLQERIGLSAPIYDFIESCKQQFTTTVLLIDQIDALSQSMSSDRSYLQVFKDLVAQYLYDKNLRIIVSVRLYDLHYDPALRVYKNIESIVVGKLSEEQVYKQLAKIGIEQQMIPVKLLELLKTPNHLNVFARIYKSNNKSLGIINVQQLYQELWKQKVTALPENGNRSRIKVKELLYQIAQKMFLDQQIFVSEFQFEDFFEALSYLESERLLKKEGTQIQFFHQTFYDFIFAKQFIEHGRNLSDYVKDSGQSLNIRSAVKMMIHYQRDYSPKTYISTLQNLFFDHEILFHIKHLAFSNILFHEYPSKEEEQLVKRVIASSFHLCILFFQGAVTKNWFRFALDNNLLSVLDEPTPTVTTVSTIDPREYQVIKNACFFYLRSAVLSNYDDAWTAVLSLQDHSQIQNILFINQDWSNPLSYQAFERCKDYAQVDPFGYYQTLNNIAKVNQDYVLKLLLPHLEDHHQKKSSARDYQEHDVLKTLASRSPEKLAPILLDAIWKDFNQIEHDRKLIGDYVFMRVDLQDKESLTGSHYLYRLLAVCLKRWAAKDSSTFVGFFNQHKNSRYKPVLRLLIFALKSQEKAYSVQLFELFTHLFKSDELDYDSSLAIEMKMVFESTFLHFSKKQQAQALEKIRSISYTRDHIGYHKERDFGQKVYCSFGISRFTWLRKMPTEYFKGSPELWREYRYLERRYSTYKEKLPSGPVMAGIVGTPLPSKAYEQMSNEQWMSSFKKFDGKKRDYRNNHLRGNIDEHASAFKKAVKENPTWKKLELIKQSWLDPEVKPKYPLYGLWGWSESNADVNDIASLFAEIANTISDETEAHTCSYIAKTLVGHDKDNEEIVKYLCEKAIDFKNEEPFLEDEDQTEKETSTNGLISRGINTINGSAAEALVHISDKTHSELVFSTLDVVLEKGPKATRSAVLFQFAYLMNVDRDRAFNLFLKALISEVDIYVIASAIWSMQYMGNHDFGKLVPIYEKLVSSNKLGQEDSHWLFTILYGSYLHKEPDAERLLKLLITNNQYAIRNAINDIIQHYYLIEGTKELNDELLDYVLCRSGEDDLESMSWNFSATTDIKLVDIAPFLKKYIQLPCFRISDQLIEYLSFQCNLFPMIAIELFELAVQSNKFNKENQQGIYTNDTGTKFIIRAFNALIKNDQTSKHERDKLMKAFDLVLMDYRFRTDTDRLIDDLV